MFLLQLTFVFSTKIDNIRNHIVATHTIAASSSDTFAFSGVSLSNFAIHDSQSLCNTVSKLKASTSRVDPIPSCLFKSCFDSLSPFVLRIINNSLCTGVVPAALKTAAVTPVPTNNMDFDNLNNFRPISNLPFLAKILEQTVASQLLSHLSANDLFEPLQSGFRKLHSTETALVKVTNDLLMASDSGRLSILTLLDLSAAFDSIDHSILINRLETVFGVSDFAVV